MGVISRGISGGFGRLFGAAIVGFQVISFWN